VLVREADLDALVLRDAIVEPGLVLGAVRVNLEAPGRYTWLPRRQVVDVGPDQSRELRAVVSRDSMTAESTQTHSLYCSGR